MGSRRYCLVTPCRDEAKYARRTLESVVSQSVPPALWVIVDDGSRDETPEILAEYAARFPFIRVVRRPDRGDRRVGGGVIDAFYSGYDTIDPKEFEFVCKLDLDLDLPPRYFELLMQRMEAEPRIGTCSGKAYFPARDEPDRTPRFPITDLEAFVSEKIGDDHSLGMVKFYRTSCFEQIGGFVRELMWDGIDSHRCRQLGWIATSWDDPELRFIHLRPMGTSHRNWWTGRVRHGFGQYFMGTGPVWMLASAAYRMTRPPVLLGGIAMLWGYFRSLIRREPRYGDSEFRRFLRRYQWACLTKGKARALRELDARQASVWNRSLPPGPIAGTPGIKVLLIVLLGLALLEIAATGVLALRPSLLRGLARSPSDRRSRLIAGIERTLANRPEALAVHDPKLGWKTRPGLHYGPDDIDDHSLRSKRAHEATAPSGVLRIAAFGDSFVYGSEVDTDEAWPNLLEKIRPNTEVLNYGVPGYGQDQIYLRFLAEAEDLKPRIVLFGVATPTLDRLMSVFGAFRSLDGPVAEVMTKPRFVLDDRGELALLPNPLERLDGLRKYLDEPRAIESLGRFDFWYEPLLYESWWFDHSRACRILFSSWAIAKRRYFDPDRPLRGPPGRAVFNESSSSFRILTKLLDGFREKARRSGIEPVVLLLPDGYAIERSRRGQDDVMTPLRKYCEQAGIPYEDASRAFLELPSSVGLDGLFQDRFHYSREGNRIVAEWMRREIDAHSG